jgi:hypothetical protein
VERAPGRPSAEGEWRGRGAQLSQAFGAGHLPPNHLWHVRMNS